MASGIFFNKIPVYPIFYLPEGATIPKPSMFALLAEVAVKNFTDVSPAGPDSGLQSALLGHYGIGGTWSEKSFWPPQEGFMCSL